MSRRNRHPGDPTRETWIVVVLLVLGVAAVALIVAGLVLAGQGSGL